MHPYVCPRIPEDSEKCGQLQEEIFAIVIITTRTL
jgi:hypothetical protein